MIPDILSLPLENGGVKKGPAIDLDFHHCENTSIGFAKSEVTSVYIWGYVVIHALVSLSVKGTSDQRVAHQSIIFYQTCKSAGK